MLEKDTTDATDEINTSSDNPFNTQISADIEVEQDKIQVILKELRVENTNVSSVLNTLSLQEKDLFDLIKFSITVEAVYDYSWYVYRKPSEVKKNFANISSELAKNNVTLAGDKNEIFLTVATWTDDSIPSHITEIENYYKILFKEKQIYDTLSFKEFFNISNASFNQYNSGSKPFEGYCYKKADPHLWRTVFSIACKCIEYFAFAQYNLRWMVVKEDCIYYLDQSNSENGKHVYFFDKDLEVKKEGTIITITNASRSLILKYKTIFEAELWYSEIMKRAEKMKQLLDNNIYKSYTNEKKGNKAHWFSDGEEYFKDLSEKLMDAKESIFITDWWMSPEVWLTRPISTPKYMAMAYQKKSLKDYPPYERLMDILYQCANRGVKVYVLIYAECSLALTLNSAHTQQALESLHPNIQVERHPLGCSDLLWSHHEKLVIIDQIIGYVGGLDLCWGRWDTHAHPIYEIANDEQNYYFPGIDYSNARIRDFDKVDNYLAESCDRATELRMPWHDVHSRLIGPVVADIARHFVERWNFARFGTGKGITDIKQNASVSKDKNKLTETNTIEEIEDKDQGKKGKYNNIMGWINKANKNLEESEDAKVEPLIPEDENEKENENENLIDTSSNNNNNINNDGTLNTKGMKMKGPTKLRGRKESKKNASGATVLRTKPKVDFTKKKGYDEEIGIREKYQKERICIDEDRLFLKKRNENENTSTRLRGRLRDNINKIRKSRQNEGSNDNDNADIINEEEGNIIDTEENKSGAYNQLVQNMAKGKDNQNSLIGKVLHAFGRADEPKLETSVVNVSFFQKGVKSTVQVLRSASKWSVGVKVKENSILQGYYHLIDNAKNYIYIENQFFVSRAFNEQEREDCEYALSDVVENMIAYHIRKRIERAYYNKEKFRVFVFIPLLPGFAGEPESSGTLQIILKHTYAGICRNHGESIIEHLEKIMGDKWKDYIGFYSLRGHDLVNNVPVTEIIYIHSKLMIVDDTEVILGSANINDRSMLGTRDSEYAVLIKEKKKLIKKMNGKDNKVANFAYSFRVNLFAEHLGLDSNDKILEDPLSDEFLKLLQNTAKNNTEIYRKLWGCYPDDQYRSLKDLKEHKTPTTKEELDQLRINYEKEKKGIVGHAVEFPLHFLENERLGVSFFSVENIVPEKMYT